MEDVKKKQDEELKEKNHWRDESELERLKEEIQYLEDEAKEMGLDFEQDIEEEIPSFTDIKDEYDDLGGFKLTDFWTWIKYFRFIINALFVGMPFLIFSALSIIWNLVLNIHFNRWWAGGNLYLIGGTLFNLF